MSHANPQTQERYALRMEEQPQKIEISSGLKRELKTRARAVQVRLRIGKQGLSGNQHTEIRGAFLGKQLLKLRFERSTKNTAKVIISQIETEHVCTLLQLIGRVATFYRPQDPGVRKEPA